MTRPLLLTSLLAIRAKKCFARDDFLPLNRLPASAAWFIFTIIHKQMVIVTTGFGITCIHRIVHIAAKSDRIGKHGPDGGKQRLPRSLIQLPHFFRRSHTCREAYFVRVTIADSGDYFLIHQHHFYCPFFAAKPRLKRSKVECRIKRLRTESGEFPVALFSREQMEITKPQSDEEKLCPSKCQDDLLGPLWTICICTDIHPAPKHQMEY